MATIRFDESARDIAESKKRSPCGIVDAMQQLFLIPYEILNYGEDFLARILFREVYGPTPYGHEPYVYRLIREYFVTFLWFNPGFGNSLATRCAKLLVNQPQSVRQLLPDSLVYLVDLQEEIEREKNWIISVTRTLISGGEITNYSFSILFKILRAHSVHNLSNFANISDLDMDYLYTYIYDYVCLKCNYNPFHSMAEIEKWIPDWVVLNYDLETEECTLPVEPDPLLNFYALYFLELNREISAGLMAHTERDDTVKSFSG